MPGVWVTWNYWSTKISRYLFQCLALCLWDHCHTEYEIEHTHSCKQPVGPKVTNGILKKYNRHEKKWIIISSLFREKKKENMKESLSWNIIRWNKIIKEDYIFLVSWLTWRGTNIKVMVKDKVQLTIVANPAAASFTLEGKSSPTEKNSIQ